MAIGISSQRQNVPNRQTVPPPIIATAEQVPAHNAEAIVPEPPDGGFTAWIQVLVGHLVIFNSWGFINSFGVFQSYYEESLSLPHSTVSWIGSIQTFFILLVGTFSGRLYDAGYYRLVLLAGCILQLTGILTTSAATEYWQLFVAQGVCQGIGFGLVFAPMVANTATYFKKKRVIAISICACGGATGGIFYPLLAQQLLPRIGFGWTVRTMALIVLSNSIIIMIGAKPRTIPRRKGGPLVDWVAFKEIPFLLYCIGMWFTFWPTFFAYYYARAYAIDVLRASQDSSFNILLIINATGIPGRLLPALVADRYIGALSTLIPIALGGAICIFAWNSVRSLQVLYVWVAFFGFFGAGIQSLMQGSSVQMSRDPEKTGTRVGMVFTFLSVAALTGPPVAGQLIQSMHGDYLGAQLWGGSVLIMGCVFLAAAQWFLGKGRYRGVHA